MITMMGARSSGKTSYLIALYWDISARQEQDATWAMEALNDRARKLVLKGFEQFTRGEFPDPTMAGIGGAGADSLRYRLSKPVDGMRSRIFRGGSKTESMDLDMLDPSGEYFSEPDLLMASNAEANAFRESLINSTGILCIIDPDRADGNQYFPLLFRNFTQLSTLLNGEGGGKLDIPVAVCVAKADQYPEAFDNPREFLRKWMGRVAFGVLLTYCEVTEFFAVSAVGRNNVEKDPATGLYRPKGEPQPEKVFEPLDWLLKNQR